MVVPLRSIVVAAGAVAAVLVVAVDGGRSFHFREESHSNYKLCDAAKVLKWRRAALAKLLWGRPRATPQGAQTDSRDSG